MAFQNNTTIYFEQCFYQHRTAWIINHPKKTQLFSSLHLPENSSKFERKKKCKNYEEIVYSVHLAWCP